MKFTKGNGKKRTARKNPALYGTPEQRATFFLQQMADSNQKKGEKKA